MTTSIVQEETTETTVKVGELYTNDEVIMMCTEVNSAGFVGVVVHRYPRCSHHDYYIGATDVVLNGSSERSVYYADSFRKFKGEVTLKS